MINVVCTIVLCHIFSNFENKVLKNPILIRISSNSLHIISTCICIIDLSPPLIQSYLCTVHSLLPVDIILIPPYTTCSISMCTDVPLINFMIGLTLERKTLFV